MTDRLTPEQRHRVMSRIHGKGTKPELKVRQWLWQHGYRYRLNVKSVPGKPDIVMRRYRTAIFVNGCFWHSHHVETQNLASLPEITNSSCCKIPQTNREFWVNKIKRNQERDQQNYQVLHDNGWQVIVVWECQLTPKRIEETMLIFAAVNQLKRIKNEEDYYRNSDAFVCWHGSNGSRNHLCQERLRPWR